MGIIKILSIRKCPTLVERKVMKVDPYRQTKIR